MKKATLIIIMALMQTVAFGQGWFELGTGSEALNAMGGISTICSDTDGNIYAAGGFMDSDWAFGKNYVAKWDNILHNWSELGGKGVNALNANDLINSICVDKFGEVFAAGDFTDSMYFAFTEGYEYVAKWDPTTGGWSKLGEGANALNAQGTINSICVDDSGHVYAAGNFRNSLGQSYVAKWNGTYWGELYGLNANLFIYSICIDDSFNVYAAGDFSDPAGHVYVAKYTVATSTWSELGTGFDSGSYEFQITSIFTDTPNHVYAAVNYGHGTVTSNIFKWDGVNWNELGSLNANLYTQSICMGDSGFVYAGGSFANASGKHYVAQWNPQTNNWTELGGFDALNANSDIAALCIDNNHNIYAAGGFTDSISHSNNYSYVAEYGISTLNIVNLNAENNEIWVYPNPTVDMIIVHTISAGYPLSYSLYDITGKMIGSGILQLFGDTKLDVKNLQIGMYLLKVNNTVVKFIKN